MIIITAIVKCNVCLVEAATTITDTKLILPSGWVGMRWKPGILTRPGQPTHKIDKHCCSEKCKVAFQKQEDQKQEEDRSKFFKVADEF